MKSPGLPLIILFAIITLLSCSPFNLNIMPEKRQIEMVKNDTIYLFSLTGKTKKPEKHKFYFWYSQNDIKKTQGYYAGKLLDGKYIVTDRSRNLVKKGHFEFGLKEGEWIEWYETGVISSVTKWKNGVKEGKFQNYDKEGQLLATGEFKNGLLHGSIRYFYQDSLLRVDTYNRGKLLEEVQKEDDIEGVEKDTVATDLTELTY